MDEAPSSVTIGRADENDVVVKGHLSSRLHARIVRGLVGVDSVPGRYDITRRSALTAAPSITNDRRLRAIAAEAEGTL